jgi:hypothetical protein
VGGHNRPNTTELRDDLDDDAWFARREKQRQANFDKKRA